ncbi:dimethyladenosine transferase 2, mitochondrial [Bacillus rossius redtenbacheri]|uniref:dimethyladenosine transferase 2, mitochondrial n=1 Tax=Bacillus rossius redtenbacheri TaxID=93214 RepID=UPI002FDEBD1D
MKDFNLFGVSKIVFQDKTDNGTRLHTLMQDLTRKEWTAAEPAMRIIGVLPSLTFAKHLMLSFIFQSGFMAYGRPELYLVMEPLLYTHLTCDGKSGFILYRTSSVLFQLIFEHQVLAKLPSKALFPWYVDKSRKKIPKFNKGPKLDPEWVYLVKCVPRRDFYDTVVPQEQLQPLWFFIRQNMSSRHNRIIPQLERWIPGCGPRLIAKDVNIYSRFGDLSPRQILSTFRDFSGWPEYPACAFRASVEEAYLKMEPGSDDLDDVPAGRRDVDEAEDEDAADEMGADTDHKPS